MAGLLQFVACLAEDFRFSLHEDLTAARDRPALLLLNGDFAPIVEVGYADVFDTQRYQSMQEQQSSAHAHGGQLVFSATAQLPPIKPYISQSIPNVWRVILPKEWPFIEQPVFVQWQMRNSEKPKDSQIKAEAWVQRRFTRPDGVKIIEGGVNLQIAVETLQTIDQHGRLLIDLQEF